MDQGVSNGWEIATPGTINSAFNVTLGEIRFITQIGSSSVVCTTDTDSDGVSDLIDIDDTSIYKLKQIPYSGYLNVRSNEDWARTILTKYKNIKKLPKLRKIVLNFSCKNSDTKQLALAMTALELIPAAKAATVTAKAASSAVPSGVKADIVGQTKAVFGGDMEFLKGTPTERSGTVGVGAQVVGQDGVSLDDINDYMDSEVQPTKSKKQTNP